MFCRKVELLGTEACQALVVLTGLSYFIFFFWSGFPLICNFTPSRIAHSLFPSASIIDHIFCRRGRLILHLIVIHLLLLCEH
jgi:hypothetical protein